MFMHNLAAIQTSVQALHRNVCISNQKEQKEEVQAP